MMESRSILTVTRNVCNGSCSEKQNIMCSVFLFFENHAVCEKMCEKYCRSDRLQMAIWRMRIACWVPNDTNTH